MEGYLLKYVNVFARWQQRYFILNQDVLTYCEIKGGPAKGQIHLKVAGIILIPDEPLKFVINTGTTEIQLIAQSIQDKIHWVNALKSAQESCTQTKQTSFETRIQEILSNIWLTHAAFDETLSLLSQQVPSHLRHLMDKLESLGSNLKAYLTNGCSILEDEKHRQNNQTIYESFNEVHSEIHYNHNQQIPIERRIHTEEYNISPQKDITKKLGLFEILEPIRHQHPIKYRNIINNPVFQKLSLTNAIDRRSLQYEQDPHEKMQIWPFLKEVIGKDLTKIPMPLIFHQPLSQLQMVGQSLDYVDNLKKAAHISDSCMRMCHVIAFTLSRQVAMLDCLKKPFNPILGETFEFEHPDFTLVAEQVVHHPPISAVYIEGPEFKMWFNTDANVGFGGTCIKVIFTGVINIILRKYNEHYTYTLPLMLIKNLIFGEKYFEHVGDVKYTNHTTGDIGIVHMKERNWNGTDACQIVAEIMDATGAIKHRMSGAYSSEIYADNECIWKRKRGISEFYYGYTHLSMQLNYLNADILRNIPCTDSRLRPDVIALECGWKSLGQDEKVRIEEKQRERRKVMESAKQEHIPRFFELKWDQYSKANVWTYKGNYWIDKHEGLDIF